MTVIREAVMQDADGIAEICTNSLGYPCRSELVAKRLRDLDTEKQKVFVAVEDNSVAGFVHAELFQALYYEDLLNILGLAVRKSSRRKGCGTRLMEAAELWATEMNCTAVRLNSSSCRTEAHRFYEKLGYKNTKSQKRFIKALR